MKRLIREQEVLKQETEFYLSCDFGNSYRPRYYSNYSAGGRIWVSYQNGLNPLHKKRMRILSNILRMKFELNLEINEVQNCSKRSKLSKFLENYTSVKFSSIKISTSLPYIPLSRPALHQLYQIFTVNHSSVTIMRIHIPSQIFWRIIFACRTVKTLKFYKWYFGPLRDVHSQEIFEVKELEFDLWREAKSWININGTKVIKSILKFIASTDLRNSLELLNVGYNKRIKVVKRLWEMHRLRHIQVQYKNNWMTERFLKGA